MRTRQEQAQNRPGQSTGAECRSAIGSRVSTPKPICFLHLVAPAMHGVSSARRSFRTLCCDPSNSDFWCFWGLTLFCIGSFGFVFAALLSVNEVAPGARCLMRRNTPCTSAYVSAVCSIIFMVDSFIYLVLWFRFERHIYSSNNRSDPMTPSAMPSTPSSVRLTLVTADSKPLSYDTAVYARPTLLSRLSAFFELRFWCVGLFALASSFGASAAIHYVSDRADPLVPLHSWISALLYLLDSFCFVAVWYMASDPRDLNFVGHLVFVISATVNIVAASLDAWSVPGEQPPSLPALNIFGAILFFVDAMIYSFAFALQDNRDRAE